jgi:hypothetical protein
MLPLLQFETAPSLALWDPAVQSFFVSFQLMDLPELNLVITSGTSAPEKEKIYISNWR